MYRRYALDLVSSRRIHSYRFLGSIPSSRNSRGNQSTFVVSIYTVSAIIVVFGTSYAFSPLYKMLCQKTGIGGTLIADRERIMDPSRMVPQSYAKPITVHFTSGKSGTMPWTFTPCQQDVSIVPGETALAFYTASSKASDPTTGIATYNIVPPAAASYFNKIQCFCFEEQTLLPGETVDMPVYFYIDPEYLQDQALIGVTDIVLSYTFFPAKSV